MPPEGKTYHEYSDDERASLAQARMMRLMAAHGEVQAMLTFLGFGWGAIANAASKRDPELVQVALATVRTDVADVAKAAQKLIDTYGWALEQIATEWRDTLAHEAEQEANNNGATETN